MSAPEGGVCSRGVSAQGVSAPGESAPGGCLLQGVSPPRGVYIPACTEADTPPVDRHTPVKILPWQLRCGR